MTQRKIPVRKTKTVTWVVTWKHLTGGIQTRHFTNRENVDNYINSVQQAQWIKLAKLETVKTEIDL